MSMSTHVIGFKPPDQKWHLMKAVYDACELAEVAPPSEVSNYFDHQEPDAAGVEVEIPHEAWVDDMRKGIQVDLSKITSDVKVIRFYNSY